MLNIPDTVVVANAFHAKQKDFIDYKGLDTYRITLYKALTKKEKYVFFNASDSFHPCFSRLVDSTFNIGDKTFYRSENGIMSLNGSSFDDEFINDVNSIYDPDIIDLFNESRKVYAEADTKPKEHAKKAIVIIR